MYCTLLKFCVEFLLAIHTLIYWVADLKPSAGVFAFSLHRRQLFGHERYATYKIGRLTEETAVSLSPVCAILCVCTAVLNICW